MFGTLGDITDIKKLGDVEILPDLQYRRPDWLGKKGLPIHADMMRRLLGYEGRLPEHSFGPVKIGGTVVYVLSRDAAKEGGHFHRVRATCRHCSMSVPFGRLSQHQKGKFCRSMRGGK